ncbi:hypothetical protein F5Y18DRAFT_359134 [Xylariaceae sp. FL1019]|nr:hypothetical protein F5Y18DRAFT_359134 [Xylariaceae sp. FL1019]
MGSEPTARDIRILVTGFGPFLDVTRNPSWEIASRLPSSLPGIQILVPPEPIPAVYHSILSIAPKLIQDHDPDIVLHIGVAVGRNYFAVEKSANRDAYNMHPDEDHKIMTKAETKTIWGKESASKLVTGFDLDVVVARWKSCLAAIVASAKTNSLKCGRDQLRTAASFDVRATDIVGNYVCGLTYYTSLAELEKIGKRPGSAVFFHVPHSTSEIEVEKGLLVTVALIEALAEAYRNL